MPNTLSDQSSEETEMPETPTFGRYAEIPYDQMTPEQQEAYRSSPACEARWRTRTRSGCTTRNWRKSRPRSAGISARQLFADRAGARDCRLAINSTWHSAYPTAAHERRGKEVGLPADKVEAMLSGLPTSFDDKREQVVYEMAICLSKARWVSQGLYDRAVEALGHVGITDVITLMGHYTSVSMTLAFYDVPAGAPGMGR